MKKTAITPFPSAFYVANTMEIFERLAWYGMYTLLASYIMTPHSQGGLGLGNTERGLIMGVVPFFLYLFPVISGALADRFGYRKMFLLSFVLMAPSYYFLGYATSLGSFISIFMLIALGAGIFKPVVIATISRSTDHTNRGLGFGIFYMMVNIGGFLGPFLAPIIQKNYGWQWVFTFAAIWIAINFIPALFFYKEPVRHAKSGGIKQVFKEMQEVLGNSRLALLVVPLLVLLVAFYAGIISSGEVTSVVAFVLIATAIIWDIWARKLPKTDIHEKPWYQQAMQVGNKAFMVYLLIITGFWVVYLQIFITLPVYIRDFVDTSDLVRLLHSISPWLHETLTSVNLDALTNEIVRLSQQYNNQDLQASVATVKEIASTLAALDIRVPQNELVTAFTALAQSGEQLNANSATFAAQWATDYRQINPATLLSIDFLMIILFQVLISRFIQRYKALPTLIAGTAILSVAMFLGGLASGVLFGGLMIAVSVIIFAVGEMTASPKSQEYVASFAPADKAAMFMGYYFVSMALGNLFAGLLSGWLYQSLAVNLANPTLMWTIIALLGIVTCCALYIFNRTLVADIEQQQLQQAQVSQS
ncbi:Major Facilitator Superfamily protein [Colwellia chukchiensis]|uniref:Major Facilitator Superfamily protein n=1 Tax=Colwellia chukchiensis TaxID=641665 RepID=A0A1H7ML01_9GAMM|nr:MFS transporter [Colwellia chukchiensis]SEL11966.1 Major Facilitator Superfamily protein [Colwellia chukchiensis]